jgi:ParB family chromosome partitioning protein
VKEVVSVNPFRCRMWALHDRIDNYVTEETCRAEINSFLRYGQLVTVLGRPVRGDPDYDVELIYGARRLFVARHVNKPLLVELREMSDLEAVVVMDIENRHRQDISPYERGRSYVRWLRSGCFRSQEELARTLKISCAGVSRLLRVAQLPAVVVSAFGSPIDICEDWGLKLMDMLEDPLVRRRTLERARAIAARPTKLAAREVFQELISMAAPGKRIQRKAHDEIVRDQRGAPLFRVRQLRSSIALVVPIHKVSGESLDRIRTSVVEILSVNATRPASPSVKRTNARNNGVAEETFT